MTMNYRNEINHIVETRKSSYTHISDSIWEFAESRFQEYRSSNIQQEYLRSQGFAIQSNLSGEETAFIAEWGNGKPIIAFVGEFDALSSLQQEADKPERCLIPEKENGHGCGHHLLGTGSLAAADSLKAFKKATWSNPIMSLIIAQCVYINILCQSSRNFTTFRALRLRSSS